MDNKLLDQLIDVLQQEKDTYARLLDCARQKRECIIQNDVDALTQIVQTENELIHNAGKFARDRAWISTDLAVQAGVESRHVTLGQLVEKMPGNYPVQVTLVRSEFLKLIEILDQANQFNRELIQAQLRFVDSEINFMSQAGAAVNNYDQSGYVDSPDRVRLIDTSI